MTTTLVQQYLLTRSLSDLESERGIKARVHGHKFSLNYSQIESKDEDPIAQECRGLILSPTSGQVSLDRPLGETIVLARPFHRFFNLGQGAAAPVDFDHPETRFYEKMDGTLTILYFDSVVGAWHVATRAVAEADLPIDGFGEFTFRTLFEKACLETIGESFNDWTAGLARSHTYMFELTTPLNRIVVDYQSYGITLLGCRDTHYGYEMDPIDAARQLGVPHAPVYRFGSTAEMVDFVSGRDPSAHEGIVVCDPEYRRVKIKNAGYLALNKVRDSVMNSPRGFVELVLLEKLDDALPLLPESIQGRGLAIRDGFRKLLRSFERMYCSAWDEVEAEYPIFNPGSPALVKAHRKAFALAVQSRKGWMSPAMEIYQGRCANLLEWVMSKRQVDGGWSNSFLDSLLRQIERQ